MNNINRQIVSLFYWKLRVKLSQKILMLLCVSPLVLLIVSLVGIERTSKVSVCKSVAVMLHYFISTTFFWMCVEAVHLYQKVVKVFQTRSQRIFLLRAPVTIWGKFFTVLCWASALLLQICQWIPLRKHFPEVKFRDIKRDDTFAKISFPINLRALCFSMLVLHWF